MSVRDVIQSAAGASGGEKLYPESVFSTYLYTGNGTGNTISNGIDLATEGGLAWIKARSAAGYNHALFDTERGANYRLKTDTTDAQNYSAVYGNVFNTDGFDIAGQYCDSGVSFASWTFRKAPKFFDVVTYTGDGTSSGIHYINHSLGVTPGMLIVKRTDSTSDWFVWHKDFSNTNDNYLRLNLTNSAGSLSGFWGYGGHTDTQFLVYNGANDVGATYVAYLFAHNAGGFGDDGLQDIISCGSYTAQSGAKFHIELGWEPQYILVKSSSTASNWHIIDNMRGMLVGDTGVYDQDLRPNRSDAEANISAFDPSPTGFYVNTDATSQDPNESTNTYIYIAIRRPMKTPESGSEVFATDAGIGDNDSTGQSLGFASDLFVTAPRNGAGYYWYDRLRGSDGVSLKYLTSTSTIAEASASDNPQALSSDNVVFPASGGYWNSSARNFSRFNFKRAPGFFDVVHSPTSYTVHTEYHNLGVVPELMICKSRTSSSQWFVYNADVGNTKTLYLNTNQAPVTTANAWNNTSPTTTQFTLGAWHPSNTICYLFATLPGVSKVGSYTGNGSSQTIDCGFSTGARFVLIKRTGSTGDWYLFDSTRGIVSGNDPFLLLDSTAAENSSYDAIDPTSSGFIVNEDGVNNLNQSGQYIYLAIA